MSVSRIAQFILEKSAAKSFFRALFCASIVFSVSLAAAENLFFLVPLQGGEALGPFPLSQAAVMGVTPVDGRISRYNDVMYSFRLANEEKSAASVQSEEKSAAKTIAPPRFEKLDEPPTPIPVPPKEEYNPVKEKERGSIPEVTDTSWYFHAWLAPIDKTTYDWKLSRLRANDTAITRSTLGVGATRGSWNFAAAYSFAADSDSIVPEGLDMQSASLDDGKAFALEVAYLRKVFLQGRWSASAGVRGTYRKDEGTLNVKTSSHLLATNSYELSTGRVDLNAADFSLTEFAIWLDAQIEYDHFDWGVLTAVNAQPLNALDVDCSFNYGDTKVNVDASRDLPLGFKVGAWFYIHSARIFTDITFPCEITWRLGISGQF